MPAMVLPSNVPATVTTRSSCPGLQHDDQLIWLPFCLTAMIRPSVVLQLPLMSGTPAGAGADPPAAAASAEFSVGVFVLPEAMRSPRPAILCSMASRSGGLGVALR